MAETLRAESSAAPSSEPGQQVGNFRIVRLIGKGGFGSVYEATHEVFGRRAAIKFLLAEHAQNPQIQGRFTAEARILDALSHKSIVSVFDAGFAPGGDFYIAMEYLDGRTLRDRLASGPLGVDGLRLCGQVAAAVAAAHLRGIVHRDLKPENVMLVRDPAQPERELAKVVDFGIAKIKEDAFAQQARRQSTGVGVSMGTPAYMAPELWGDAAKADGKVDVYALGIILYECLAGARPFEAPSMQAWVLLHLQQQPPPLAHLDPAVPAAAIQLLLAMLHKDAAQRPTMEEVAETLERLTSPAVPAWPSGDRVASPPRQRPWLWAVAPAVLLMVAGTAALVNSTRLAPAGAVAPHGLLAPPAADQRSSAPAVASSPPAAASAPTAPTATPAPPARDTQAVERKTPARAGTAPEGIAAPPLHEAARAGARSRPATLLLDRATPRTVPLRLAPPQAAVPDDPLGDDPALRLPGESAVSARRRRGPAGTLPTQGPRAGSPRLVQERLEEVRKASSRSTDPGALLKSLEAPE